MRKREIFPKWFHPMTCFWEHFASFLNSWTVTQTHISFEEIYNCPSLFCISKTHGLGSTFFEYRFDLTKLENKSGFGLEFSEEKWILLIFMSDANCSPWPWDSPSFWMSFSSAFCLYTFSALSLPFHSAGDIHSQHTPGTSVLCTCPMLQLTTILSGICMTQLQFPFAFTGHILSDSRVP